MCPFTLSDLLRAFFGGWIESKECFVLRAAFTNHEWFLQGTFFLKAVEVIMLVAINENC